MALKELIPVEAAGSEPQVRVQTVTPEMAAAWLATDLYVRQRRLRDWHVKRLAVAIARGEFKPGTLEFCVVDGKRYLVDGQHRLMAVVTSETNQTFAVVEYHYPAMEEVETHYARTDIGVKRMPGEAPALQRFREEHQLTDPAMKGVIGASGLLIKGFEHRDNDGVRREPSPDERAYLANQFASEITGYFSAISHGKPQIHKHLRKGGTTAVGILTFRHQKEKAKPFWERVAALGGYEENTGESHLVAFFLDRGQTRLRGEELARWVARCWNAYFGEVRVTYLRAPDMLAPIKIAGTHYDGKNVRLL